MTGLTEQTRTIVTDGLEVVRDSLKRMDEIKNANAETLAGIKELGDKIVSIWEIVNMINGIADQTKIIAFNAELKRLPPARPERISRLSPQKSGGLLTAPWPQPMKSKFRLRQFNRPQTG